MDSFTELPTEEALEIERRSRMDLLFRNARLEEIKNSSDRFNKASERDTAALFLQLISYSPELTQHILEALSDEDFRLTSDLYLPYEEEEDHEPTLMNMCKAFLEYRKMIEGISTYPDHYALGHLQFLMKIQGGPGSKHYESVLENHPNIPFAKALKQMYGMTNFEVDALDTGNGKFDEKEFLEYIENRIPVSVDLGEDGKVEIDFHITLVDGYLDIDTYAENDREFYPQGDNTRNRMNGTTLPIVDGQVEWTGYLYMGFLLFGYDVRYKITDLDKEKPTVTILGVQRNYHESNKYIMPPMSDEEADKWHKEAKESGFEA